ncbi:MAG: hypothetical protein PHC50_03385 [Candidatus Cloacimonetes bacterium]|nr:hypothetical protein [Candidatus Cloacimonadota bacterium]
MKAIPLTPVAALAQVNLPLDLAGNPVFTSHTLLVMSLLQDYSTTDAFEEATLDIPEPTTPLTDTDPDLSENENDIEAPLPLFTPLQIQFRAAFAFLLLASTAEFLNLKTLGEGIVKTVGLDAAATQLLTGHEIEAFASRLTRRALLSIQPWLSPAGLATLELLSPENPKPLRISLI